MIPKNNTSKSNTITGYWITTGLLTFGMLAGGIAQVAHAKFNVDGFIRLNYPLYFMSIIGTWKILGVIALLIPGFPLLKEWAYAGFFYAMTGAVLSHLICGDGVKETIAPFVFGILTVFSWYLRPANRRVFVAPVD